MPIGAFASDSSSGLAVDRFTCVSEGLAKNGWCVVDDFISQEWAAELLEEQRLQSRNGAFHPAGIGRATHYMVNEQTRRDHILWLDRDNALPAQQQFLALLEALRQLLNRDLFLGLHTLDIHAADYPPGGFYRRHLDAFRRNNLRILTVILYLNPRWHARDGGALRLFLDNHGQADFMDIPPEAGRLVTFLSDRFYHEVRQTHRLRSTLTGWFAHRPGL